MQLWNSLEFGAKAFALKSVNSKSREEVEAISRDRLRSLVGHARDNSRFWHDKLATFPKRISNSANCRHPTNLS